MQIMDRNLLKVSLLYLSLLTASVPALAQNLAVRSILAAPGDESARVTLVGNTHPLATVRNDAGPAPDSLSMERMLLLIHRSPEQEALLQKLMNNQQSNGSPLFHKWLTPQEFGAQFGVSDEALGQVTGWLSTQGFQVNRISHGRSIIEFSGTAGQVRHAFRTEIHSYVVNGQKYWANNADPQIPAALAPAIQGIVSLHNFPTDSQKRQAALLSSMTAASPRRAKPEFTFPANYCASDGNCYAVAPADFATIYNVAPLWAAGIDGTGETIAIASGSNIRPTDAHNFRQLFNLPANDPVVFVDGTDPGIVPIEEIFTNFAVQWTGAVAKNATLELVVAQSTAASRGTDLAAIYIIDNNLASVLTESLVACEDSLGADGNVFYSSLWEQAAAEGITVVIPTGDTGSAACDSSTTETSAIHGLGINGVASTPYNVAIGGTDFNQSGSWSQYWNTSNDPTTGASAKSYILERVYNDTCTENGPNGCPTVNPSGSDLIAGGGGLSKYNQTPPWQNVGSFQLVGSRGVPDFSLFAGDGNDGSFYIICQEDAQLSGPGCNLDPPYTSFANIGGTTGAASAFAGIMALVNQKTGSRQGNANFVLYPLAALPASGIFHDVSVGSNSVACAPGSPDCSMATGPSFGYIGNPPTAFYGAYPGYDLATGWGSVDANSLVNQWSSITFAPTNTTLTNFSPTNFAHSQPVTFTITVAPQGGSGTPTGDVALMVHPSAGSPYAADVLTLQNGTITASTSVLPGGSYQVTAHYAGDGTFATSDSTPISITVAPQASQIALSIACQTQNLEFSYGSYTILGNVNITGEPCVGVNTTNYPTGSVQLTADGNPLDAGTYNLSSRAQFEDHAASLAPGPHTLAGAYSGDNSYGHSVSAPLSVLIDPGVTTVTLTANPTTAIAGTSVVLTAVVNTSSFAAPPSGTITFSSSTGQLGQVAVSPVNGVNYVMGTAMLTFSPTNTVSVTASYSGDTNYTNSSSRPVTITSGTPDFLFGSQVTPLVIPAGQTGMATITATPQLGYTGTVALACPTSLPPGITCSISPSSLVLPSNGNPVTSTLSIQTTGPSKLVASRFQDSPAPRFSPVFSASIAFGALFLLFFKRPRFKVLLSSIALCGILLFAVSCSQAVGGGSSKDSGIALTTSMVKVPQGSSITLSAAISANHSVGGTVDFLDNGVAIASAVPLSIGRATFTTNALTIGTHSLTATYSGDSQTNMASTSSPLYQVITGDFNVQVSGTSGALTHTFNIDVTLQ
jgi:hypothetical protein